ncbi:ShlB/FhaC/HecB family hemolysin secretion/activation protein [Xenophilus arseniciresistens]|uniref:ShlB/FhaC/HecB family hemolysin secretion/activation protein n=1 Tax=Xenophilus arseniciresistens TaxID=1283306 RepID=A0AAE3N9X5_9BURK|nr:ShlB/FhaC/HecB family hemolysin secretion/activation protein [Xenophilus arseniciresistens]MDA7418740.1 ShlB/FhaC/HecB family hemolysin secretion/activation protein [Xenophilus arseniciresistens]
MNPRHPSHRTTHSQSEPTMKPRHRNSLAWAAGTLCALMALPGWAQNPSQSLPGGTPLLPTADPCSSCAAPTGQGAPAVPQGQPAAAAAGAGATFRLNDLRLNGAEALSAEELRSTTAPYIGRDVALADLEALAQAITQRYRDRGYFLAQAVVPVQTVRDGVVEISIIEGRIGNVEVIVAPDAPISEARVRALLAPVASGQVINAPAYERAMLLLADQPGLRVGSTLSEGSTPGTSDLNVEVNPGPRWQFSAEADNHGTKESGRFRVGGTARLNSPFGIGDNLDVRLLVSNGNALNLGRVSYEAPLGGSGLRMGVGAARVSYDVGGEFAELGAQGKADVFDVSLSYPLIRQRRQNLYLRLAADSKQLTDEYTALYFQARKRVRGLGLGWAWELRDDFLGGGYWASAGTLYHGKLSLRDFDSQQFDAGVGGHNTAGGFSKATFQFSRLQGMFPGHSLYLSLGGQWANKNLDASEKLSLGGARAVRAYASGEVLVDQGLIGMVEWRWALNDEFTPFVFYDAARGRQVKDPTIFDAVPNSRSLRGAGIGLSWTRPGNFAINATLAWRAGTEPGRTDGGGRNPRLYVQAQKTF